MLLNKNKQCLKHFYQNIFGLYTRVEKVISTLIVSWKKKCEHTSKYNYKSITQVGNYYNSRSAIMTSVRTPWNFNKINDNIQ